MLNNKLIYYACLFIMALTLYLLISGSELLLVALMADPYIPLGTLLCWMALISVAAILKMSSHLFTHLKWRGNWFNRVSHILFIGAILWAPICAILAGNFSNSFSGSNSLQGGQLAMKTFWIYSFTWALSSILLLFTLWIRLLWQKIK